MVVNLGGWLADKMVVYWGDASVSKRDGSMVGSLVDYSVGHWDDK